MEDTKMLNYIKDVLDNMPPDWLNLTTHRLDVYNEKLAKVQFLEQFENLYNNHHSTQVDVGVALSELPTAYDYIRLGHPLSCILEWVIANLNNLKPKNVISFSSKTIPVLAILRKNLLDNKNTQIIYKDELPDFFDTELLRSVYGYKFDLKNIEKVEDIAALGNYQEKGSSIYISQEDEIFNVDLTPIPKTKGIDFFINVHSPFGSVLLVNGEQNENYISEIQHVRRRETIAMTPANCLAVLTLLIEKSSSNTKSNVETNKKLVIDSINEITAPAWQSFKDA